MRWDASNSIYEPNGLPNSRLRRDRAELVLQLAPHDLELGHQRGFRGLGQGVDRGFVVVAENRIALHGVVLVRLAHLQTSPQDRGILACPRSCQRGMIISKDESAARFRQPQPPERYPSSGSWS